MPAKSVVMDSSKFLSTINSSAQARIVQYENAVKSLGARVKSDWRLAALNTDKLFIENVTTGEYMEAKHARVKGGRISISDITPIKIVESKKQTTFESSCLSLVNAIEENDSKGMRSAFNALAAQRFSPNSVPADGLVRTRDGAVRKLNVVREGFDNKFKTKLVAALVESVTDTVVVEGTQIISATLSEVRRKLPISEWACRKVVGQKMRDTASNAYLSEGFQTRVKHIAGLVAEDRVQDAVKIAAKFLSQNQEFSLLTKAETTRLIENTLAAKAIMNQRLCEDVATLMFRTSLHVNKKDIVKEWKTAASRSQHPALMENVTRLESAKNFEASYDNFLKRAFCEAMSPRDEEINAYRAALGLLQNTQQVREDQELKGKIEELMHKLASTEVDGSTINLVREALAAAKKEVDQMQNLDDFDEIPGDEAAALGDDMAPAMDDAVGGGQPTIVINSPLISIGGETGGAPGPEDEMADLGDDSMGDELGGDDMGMGGEDDLGADPMGGGDDLGADMGGDLGGEGGEEDDDLAALLDSGEEEDDNDQLDLSSVQRRGSGLAEDSEWLKKTIAKRKGEKTDDSDDDDSSDDEDCDPECQMDESSDPYAYNAITSRSDIGIGYGTPVLESELPAIVTTLYNLVEDRELDAEAIAEQFVQLVKAAISDNGIHIPANKLDEAVELVATALSKSLQTLGEDQYKWGTALRRCGLGRSDFAGPKKKGGGGGGSSDSGFSGEAPEAEEGLTGSAPTVQTESIRWDQHDKAAHGISGQLRGVGFIVDYANPPALLDATGRIEVPMPANVLESALASAGLSRGNKKVFTEWLNTNIEQLRPYSASDDAALNEAVAIVTAGADGTVTVQVDGATVGEMDPAAGGMGAADPMGGEMGMDDMDADGMAPVDDMGADSVGGEEGMGDDAMPDFEAGTDAGMPDFGPEGDEGGEDEFGGEEGPGGPDEGPGGPPAPPAAGGDDMVVDDGEEDVEESGPPVKEDKDITDPESDKYRTFVNDDPRTPPKEAGKGQKPSGDGKSLEGFNKENDTMGKTSVELKSVKPGGLRN